jgi:hypothetical protein
METWAKPVKDITIKTEERNMPSAKRRNAMNLAPNKGSSSHKITNANKAKARQIKNMP